MGDRSFICFLTKKSLQYYTLAFTQKLQSFIEKKGGLDLRDFGKRDGF
jgi:hypothetical protein